MTGNARSPSEDRRVAGTMTSVLEAEHSLLRLNLGHEPEVLREVFRAEQQRCIQHCTEEQSETYK